MNKTFLLCIALACCVAFSEGGKVVHATIPKSKMPSAWNTMRAFDDDAVMELEDIVAEKKY
uniref:Uncharacterized protein n=1 Tax=Ciona savignyi TaxID=51511 RepID=H2ZCR3_CIOSA